MTYFISPIFFGMREYKSVLWLFSRIEMETLFDYDQETLIDLAE